MSSCTGTPWLERLTRVRRAWGRTPACARALALLTLCFSVRKALVLLVQCAVIVCLRGRGTVACGDPCCSWPTVSWQGLGLYGLCGFHATCLRAYRCVFLSFGLWVPRARCAHPPSAVSLPSFVPSFPSVSALYHSLLHAHFTSPWTPGDRQYRSCRTLTLVLFLRPRGTLLPEYSCCLPCIAPSCS